MTWFQRYGIPGIHFCGIWMLWAFTFYHCAALQILGTEGMASTILAIAGAFFLPVGYILSLTQQLLYLWLRRPALGITARAMTESKVFDPESTRNRRQYWLETQACLLEIEMSISNTSNGTQSSGQPRSGIITLEASRFLQDWIRSRNDVMAIDASMIVGTVLASPSVLVMKGPLDVDWNIHMGWLVFSVCLSLSLLIVLCYSWFTMSKEGVQVEAGIYRMLAGQPASQLRLLSASQRENTGEESGSHPNY